jgi:Fe2+ transport system protein FeoA
MTLGDLSVGASATVMHVGGERSFRRRLMELGLVPGTVVKLVRVAPLGDPLELRLRGCSLSIRREESLSVTVMPEQSAPKAASATQIAPMHAGLPASS